MVKQMNKVCNTNKVHDLNEFIKNCITQAFVQLLETKEFSKISITEITEKAGVARVSFYRNFESKEDVLIKYIETIFFHKTEIQYDMYDYDMLLNRIETPLKQTVKNKGFFTALHRDNLLYLIFDRLKFFTPTHIKDAGKYNYEIQPRFFAGASYGVISHWIESDFDTPAETLAKEFTDLLYKFHNIM